MDTDAANLFAASERLTQEHVKKYKNSATGLKDLIQNVLHCPDFNPAEVDQRKVRVADARKRVPVILKRRREELVRLLRTQRPGNEQGICLGSNRGGSVLVLYNMLCMTLQSCYTTPTFSSALWPFT